MPAADADDVKRNRVGRRGLLLGTTGAAMAASVTAFSPASPLLGSALRRSLTLSAPLFPLLEPGFLTSQRLDSRCRGREVELVLTLPTPNPPEGMPISLLLHGRHGSARTAAPEGLAGLLWQWVARGRLPPFGFLAVDGGDTYWHEHRPGDDPMGMLLREVPGWLRRLRLGGEDGVPFACAGISMGGFGSLLYARRRTQRGDPVRAVGAVSPALLTSWTRMRQRKAFDDRSDWAAVDPLRHIGEIGDVPIGVWCGTQDPFIAGARRFIRAARPEVAYTVPGRHDEEFFRRAVPGLVGFLGRHVPRKPIA